MKLLPRSGNFVFVCIAVLAIAVPVFLMDGGLNWLDKKVFPPRRPKFMPVNSVWIEGLSLPVSWHNGWWFGCGLSASGTANYCRLVGADGKQVYGGEYLPCNGRSPIDEGSIRLVTPRDSIDMWLPVGQKLGVIGFLSNGDLLLPLSVREKCSQVKTRLQRVRP